MTTKRFIPICLIVLATLLLVFPSATLADEVFVDCRNNSGIEDGTIDHPYKTMQAAIIAAYDGDTIRAADCIYSEAIVVNKDIEIYGSGPDVTEINSTASAEDAAVQIGSNREVTIKDFKIVGSLYGVSAMEYSAPIVANCIVNAPYCIWVGSQNGVNITIKNNTIASCQIEAIHLYRYAAWRC